MNLKQDHRDLESQFSLLSQQTAKMDGFSADLEGTREDLKHVRAVAREIGYELERLEIELGAGGRRIVLIEEARVPH